LETALLYCCDQGLFSAPGWNFFDWTKIDQNRKTVLHNSILLAGALEAGAKVAKLLGKDEESDRFLCRRSSLITAINAMWDESRQGYRDALLPTGEMSQQMSQHTSFLALLYNIVPEKWRQMAIKNCLQPPGQMTRVGSPNALFYLMAALCKEKRSKDALEILKSYWGRMLDRGAITFWEMINQVGSEFPTRSHCHGWSSSPAYFLPRLFFGIECTEPGWRKVTLRPQSFGLDFVQAEICTPHGLLKMEWQRAPDGSLEVKVKAPKEIDIKMESIYEQS